MNAEHTRGLDFTDRQTGVQSPYIFVITTGNNSVWTVRHISKGISRYGYRGQDFISGKYSLSDIIYPGDFEQAALSAEVCESGKNDVCEHIYRIILPDKSHVWVSDVSTLTRGDDGKPLYWEHVLSDQAYIKNLQGGAMEAFGREAVLGAMLNEVQNPSFHHAASVILKKTGEIIGLDRAILFEDDRDHRGFRAVCEWTGAGVLSVTSPDGHTAYTYEKDLPVSAEKLRDDGRFIPAPERLRDVREGIFQGTSAAALFPVKASGGALYGICCFEYCSDEEEWQEDKLTFLEAASRILSAVAAGRLGRERAEISDQLFEDAIDAMGSFVAVIDAEHNDIIHANLAFKKAFGENCLSKRCWDAIHGKFTEDCVRCMEHELDMAGGEGSCFEIWSEKHGMWLLARCAAVTWSDGRDARVICLEDVSFRKQSDDRIEKLARFDQLTGLPNRRRCETVLEEALARALQRGGAGYVILADIDDFKVVNDGYGHDHGDALLVEFSTFLKSLISDRVSVFRFGGDGFAIIMKDFSEQKVKTLINKLQNRTRRSWIAMGCQLFLTLSIGVAVFPQDGRTAGQILKNAETAMFEAKTQGKNRVSFFSPALEHASVRRAELERMLRDSINNNFDGFEVFYQFYTDIKDESFIGAEALLRLFDRLSGEMVMPGEFIPLAERLGLIIPLGKFVLRSAMRFCRLINNSGRPDFSMTVNICVIQLLQPDFSEEIHWLLTETGVSPKNIVFDITGSGAESLLSVSDVLKRLRHMGIRISLDNFGVGSASLESLRDAPADIIKLDSSFTCECGNGAQPERLVNMICGIGRSLGLSVGIKGVETDEQLRICRESGADFIQGFYYHVPAEQEKALEFLNTSDASVPTQDKGR